MDRQPDNYFSCLFSVWFEQMLQKRESISDWCTEKQDMNPVEKSGFNLVTLQYLTSFITILQRDLHLHLVNRF